MKICWHGLIFYSTGWTDVHTCCKLIITTEPDWGSAMWINTRRIWARCKRGYKIILCGKKMKLYWSTRPTTVPAGSDHYFTQSVRPSVRTSQNIKIKRQSLPAGTEGWPSGSLMTCSFWFSIFFPCSVSHSIVRFLQKVSFHHCKYKKSSSVTDGSIMHHLQEQVLVA